MENRELIFRAMKDDMSDPCMVFGQLVYHFYVPRITADCGETFSTCLKGTVGQYIGRLDRARYRIYEGDIIANPKGEKGLVVFHEAGFYLKSIRKNGSAIYIQLTEGFLANKKVIGNIHEHPEILQP